jgi:hypothetical protein
MKSRFALPYRKKHWDKWDNWDTRRKPAWLSGIACPVYAFVTGTLLGHGGTLRNQDVAGHGNGTARRPASADFLIRGKHHERA